MSLLSNKRVRLQVGARALHGALALSWPKRRELARTAVPLGDGAHDLLAPARPALVEGLDRALAELATGAPLKQVGIDIELADALLHFDVVRGDFGGHSSAQLAAIAQVCLRELIGDGVDDSELRWHLQADGQHLWICAVPLPLLSDLRAAVTQRGLRLRSLEPAFAACWNRHRKTLQAGLGVFASVHEGYAVVALTRNGIVEALSAARCEAPASPPGEADAPDNPLETQVRQLIASLGLDQHSIGQFVASAEAPLLSSLGPGWRCIDTSGPAA